MNNTQIKEQDFEKNKKEVEELYFGKGQLTVTFCNYYKYNFSFKGEHKCLSIYVSFGGDSGDIYRCSVTNEPIELPNSIEELQENYNYISIVDKVKGVEYTSCSTGFGMSGWERREKINE